MLGPVNKLVASQGMFEVFPICVKCITCGIVYRFVRCLDTSSIKEGTTIGSLDTSPNAQFHQCCLYWQHPNISWLQLFPRNLKKAK